MKFVFASERGRLIRERQKYVDDYNAKKTAYDTEVAQFKSASDNYSTDMENFIKAFLSSELEAIPGAQIKVRMSDKNSYTKERDYYVKMYYFSSKHDNPKYTSNDYQHNVDSGRLKGISWSYTIFIRTKTDSQYNYDTRDYDRTHTKILEKVPKIEANVLESEDLDILKKTYDLFAKIETIDWQVILDRINNGEPKEEDFIKTKNPGYLDTSELDEQITNYNIARIIGKDIWIKVNIVREESYDRYSSYSTNPGVDGKGWIKVDSVTPKFYTFHWLSGDSTSFPSGTVNSAERRTYKMKKIYIKPIEPIEYQTTDDLRATAEPSLNEVQP